jgi:hypothetical protein
MTTIARRYASCGFILDVIGVLIASPERISDVLSMMVLSLPTPNARPRGVRLSRAQAEVGTSETSSRVRATGAGHSAGDRAAACMVNSESDFGAVSVVLLRALVLGAPSTL